MSSYMNFSEERKKERKKAVQSDPPLMRLLIMNVFTAYLLVKLDKKGRHGPPSPHNSVFFVAIIQFAGTQIIFAYTQADFIKGQSLQ